MIVAIESLIPDRRAASSEKKSAPPLPHADIYPAAWLGRQQEKTIDPQPDPALVQEEDESGLAGPETTPNLAEDAPPPPGTTPSPIFDRSKSAVANSFDPSKITSWAPDAFDSAPDTRVPFWMNRTSPARRR